MGGVRFVNDSKATNPESAERALAAYPPGLRVIMGGSRKGTPFHALARTARATGVARAYLIGETAGELGVALETEGVDHVLCGDLKTAVGRAYRDATPGETIYAATGASEPLRAYQRLGLLNRDLRWGRRADWVVLEYNLAYSNWPDWWPRYRNRHPWYRRVYEVRVAGAPVLGVFRAREKMWRDPSGDVPRTSLKPPKRPGAKRFEMGAPPG